MGCFRGASAASGLFRIPPNGEARNRTGDTMIFSHVLYRLSYLAEPDMLKPAALVAATEQRFAEDSLLLLEQRSEDLLAFDQDAPFGLQGREARDCGDL